MGTTITLFLAFLQSLLIVSNASGIFGRDSGYAPLKTNSSRTDLDSPLCNVCRNDIGICCPPGIVCGSDGKCPSTAVANAGFTIGNSAEVETFVQSQDGEHLMEYGADGEENASSGATQAASSAAAESTASPD